MTRSPSIVVVDFETTGLSTDDGDRVVEVGLVRLGADLRTEREYSTLVNPERKMGASSIHGIRGVDVVDAPTFAEIAGDVGEFLEGAIIAAHNAPFDVRFLVSEFEHVGLMQRLPPNVSLAVIDTLRVSQDLIQGVSDYKLPTVCAACGIPAWSHHGALGDAKATALLLAHLAEMGGDALARSLRSDAVLLEPGWTGLAPSGRTLPRKTLATLARPTSGAPVPTSKPPPLEGEIVVFTGGVGIARKEAVRAAEMLGCEVRPGVTKKTSIVVVGDPDVGRLFGQGAGITGKHRKALELAEAGQRVRLLTESDFMRLAEVVSDGVITDEEWRTVRELVYAVGFAEPDGVSTQRRNGRRAPSSVDEEAVEIRLEAVESAPHETKAGRGHPCKTAGCELLTSTTARQYCDLCRELRAAPNAFRDGDLMGEKLFFGVAGVTNYPASSEVEKGEQLYLVRDPGNPHDPLAIEVRREDGGLVGYVPRERPLQGRYGRREYTQEDLAQALDAGSTYRLRCWAAGQGVQVEGDCEGWLVPHPARLEMWAKRGGGYGKPREPPPFEVARVRNIGMQHEGSSEQEPRGEAAPEQRVPPMLLLMVAGMLVGLAVALLR